MKKKIFTSPTITVARNLWLLIILLTGFSIGAFSQNGIITLNKTVTPKANDCGAFDVQLTIAGNPPDRPIDVIIVIDRSGSMLGTPLSNAKDAAINFATNVINASNPYRANRVGVVSYSSTAILETGLTSNLTTITNEINSLNASGSTNIQDGFVEAETELNSNAGHNCETIRAIVLLTDGVANEDNGGGCGTSVQCAISAGVDAQLCTSGEGCTPDYDTWVYTIGLFGSISGGTQTTAESTLIACQNGGYWFTESSADLNGIYNQIFGSLLWAAKSVSGQAMVVETVDSDFSITAGPVVNEGTAGAVGQTISWNLAAVYGETASLTYTIQSNNTSNCGSTTASNSTMHYETVTCNDTTVTFTNPTICVPCLSASANASVSSSSCCAIDYSISASESTACASGETFTYAWEFYDVTASAILGTSATASGTFTVPDCSTRFGHTLRATPTVTFVNGSVCSMTRQADPITFTFSDTSPSTANAGPDQSKCSGETVTLAGNTPSAGTGTWSVTSGPSTASSQFSSTSDPSAVFTPAGGTGIYTLRWTISNPPCTASYDEMTLTIKSLPSCSITGNNGPVCPSSSNDYTAPADMDTYSWSVTGNGSISGSTTSQTVTVIAGTNCNANFTVHLSVTDNGCTSTCQKVVSAVDNTAPSITGTLTAVPVEGCSAADKPAATNTLAYLRANGLTISDACGDAGLTVTSSDGTPSGTCPITIIRTYTVTDACGNLSTATQTITVDDNTKPSITGTLTAVPVEGCTAADKPAANNTLAYLRANGLTISDACGDAGLTVTSSDGTPGGTCPITIIRTYTVTDACGNLSTATQTITVDDNTKPSITGTLTAVPVEGCSAADKPAATSTLAYLRANGLTISDACGDAGLTVTSSDGTPGGTCPITIIRTYTVTDACGNLSTATQTITVDDNTKPSITGTLTAVPVEGCTAADKPAATNTLAYLRANGLTISDACGDAGLTVTSSDGTPGGTCPITIIRTYTVTDACGNLSTATQTITVDDNTKPSITGTLTAVPVEGCTAADKPAATNTLAYLRANGLTISDACGDAGLTVTSSDGTPGGTCPITIIRTYTVTDACGNLSTATQTITVDDNTKPSITGTLTAVPVEGCTAADKPAATNTLAYLRANGLTISDACGDAGLTVTSSDGTPSGTCPITIIRTYTVTDACGNLSTATQTITVDDNTKPNGTAPTGTSNINACYVNATTVPTGTPAFNATSAAAGYTDNCGGTVSAVLTNTAVTGNNCAWTVTYTFKVVDGCGNELTGQKIEHKGGDKTAPTGTPPAGTSNINACFIDATTVPAGTPAFDPIKAAKDYSDNCGGPVTAILTGITVSGDDCAWTVTYTFKVADACNNELTGQKIEHKGGDKTPPVMKMNTTCVYLTEYGKWTLVDLDKNTITKEVTDNCSDFKDLYFNFSPKSFDCNDAAKNNPVVVTATDLCNNTSTSDATVLVLDTIRPVAICRDVTRYLDQFGQTFLIPQDVNNSNIKSKFEWAVYFNLLNGGSYDNCGISEMYLDKQLFTSADTGKNTVVLSVYDHSKNINVCTAVVTVIDTFQSVLEPIDPVVKIVPPGTCTTKINYPQIKVRGNLNVTLVQMAGLGATGDFPLGTTLETWKATDEKGKVSYTSFTVTIKTYNAAPVIEAPADLTINEDAAPFEIPLSGIGFGNDCKLQLLDLTMVNGNEGLLMADLTYVKGTSSGKIMITPKANKNGEAVITLTLMDDGGTENGGIDKVVKSFKITVKPVNDVPEVVPIPDQYIVLPGTLSVNVATAFKDYDDGDVLTITLTRQDGTALPSWMTFNPSTGMLSGTPTTANTGNIGLKVTATDKAGASVFDIFLVTVIESNTATLNVSAAKGASPLTGGFMVLLYVKQGAMFNLLNFTPVFSSGTYTYNNLPYGTYLAKAVITDAAMNPGLLHTYYESSTSVTGATEVILDNTLPLTIQVKMVASTLPAGEYKIMGKVVKKTGTPDLIAQGLDPVATPAPGIDLVLKQNGLVVANTVTELNGTYEFTGLAAGVYDVFAEVPGYTQTITQKVTLSTTTPVKDKVDFTIWSSSTTFVITSVQHVESAFTFNLYPNPTTGKVFVDLTWNGLRTADVTVYSILGVQVFRKEYHSGEQITFDMSGQVTGVYMVKVNAEGRTYVKKLILDRK